MKTQSTQQLDRRAGASRVAFSLVELLVAIGAFAIVTVSVATIFSSVGDTISTGRRQSRLNNLASQIERVMRADFERMSREGFLVIRHEYAVREKGDVSDLDNDGVWDGLNVPSFPGDDDPRPRRVDSIMFFATGRFETARTEVQPGMNASGSEARIWYGHGQRKPRSADDVGYEWYSKPRLDDTMQGEELGSSGSGDMAWDRLGFDPGPGEVNPNEFASDWTLLRHVTVLAPVVAPVARDLPDFGSDGLFGEVGVLRGDLFGPDGKIKVADNPFQSGLQPAVSSIFWNAQVLDPTLAPGADGHVPAFLQDPPPVLADTSLGLYTVETNPASGQPEIASARTSSGLVDVATTSLSEIMSVVNHGAFDITEATKNVIDRENYEFQLDTSMAFGQEYPRTIANPRQMRAWMVNALPTAPLEDPLGEFATFGAGFGTDERTSPRVRYEPTPPDMFAATTPGERLLNFYEQADKEVLTRSAFVPRCTEFIVEWSYGWTYAPTSEVPENNTTPYNVPQSDPRYKQLVWFGRDRYTADWNGDGDVNASDEPAARFYERRLGTTLKEGGPPRELLTGRAPAAPVPNDRIAETMVFGQYWSSPIADGSFGVSVPGFPPGNVNPNTASNLLPWPWPKLIRVTMTIADPGDPSIESTVEVVFEVPGPKGAS